VNINIDLRENGSNHVDWISLAQDKDLWRALLNKGNKPPAFTNDLEFGGYPNGW
jgi:hypothetical protein